MAPPRVKPRYEPLEAKVDRLRRTLMACLRKQPEYRAIIARFAIFAKEDSATFRQEVRRVIGNDLRLNARDGSGPPQWAVRAVHHDVEVHVARRYGYKPYRDEQGRRFIDVMLVAGEPRFRYEQGPKFTIEISASMLRLEPPIARFDENGEWCGDEDCEDELDFLVDEGLSEDQFEEELKKRAYEYVDYAIGEIRQGIYGPHVDARHTRPSTFEKDKEIVAALVGFLLHKSRLMPSGCKGLDSRDTVRDRITNVIGIKLPPN